MVLVCSVSQFFAHLIPKLK